MFTQYGFGMSVPPRMLVTGNSGSGKGTLAARLASDLGVPHVELDGLYHGPGLDLDSRGPGQVPALVRLATAEPAWVIDGNYTSIVGQILRDRGAPSSTAAESTGRAGQNDGSAGRAARPADRSAHSRTRGAPLSKGARDVLG